ncbi:1-aminocyclopropane-1-carboxylate deaminase/D-cysteine desulfhydrase [Rufibacter quisquiliarum]|uniref:1-aminocyclopropane-1-carboxylate deaminase/D-cysteine desulfhydrase-like pyridoxal-dependent ACC family enzyme n=1 Tax=Rufibacter quisquiliarum TaxID=1549639 RepID=A0A839GG65_9BACT|nr:pyridoxal-phosphate dependent enzyme [Rufibacter quisquiliarum]MBA9077550.1 1-aminocyclopropane-1-carboxylate deaminase/D-cysteine desulfhydrase-like pyridoxal-dependent ACC family enzyme [Rufibacter quisquiliarum]
MVPATVLLQPLSDPLLTEKGVELSVLREDLLHPTIPGNKWRKLNYNLLAAREQNCETLVTFGGAFSNHIAAVAAAGQEFGFATLGYLRGEETLPLNPTLQNATACGMQLRYLSRSEYRLRHDVRFQAEILKTAPKQYLLPEGGTNLLAVKGCTEIVSEMIEPWDVLCVAAGTGGTLAGIVAGAAGKGQVIGFPALKGGNFLQEEVTELVQAYSGRRYVNWELQTSYHFGGYAKHTPELLGFIQGFHTQHGILLDPVYTGKMLFGVFDLIEKDYFARGTKIVAVHTGGQQGWKGYKERYRLEWPVL